MMCFCCCLNNFFLAFVFFFFFFLAHQKKFFFGFSHPPIFIPSLSLFFLSPPLFCSSGDSSVEFYNSYRIKFQVDLVKKDIITSAQLRMRKFFLQLNDTMQENVERDRHDRVDVRLITKPENYNGEEKHVHVTVGYLDVDHTGGMAVFNVTEAIIGWLNSPPHSVSHIGELELDIRLGCPQPLTNGNTFVPNYQFFENSDKDGMLILTTYQEKNTSQNARRKRQDINTNLTFCNENQFDCCLKPFRINFSRDLNWTWIIRPREIAFNYCKGECPIIDGYSTGNAQFLHQLRSRNPTAAPEPCCAANSFADIPVTVLINGNYSDRNLVDVVATSCLCR